MNACTELLLLAKEKNLLKIQALCLRQKSYCYYGSGRPLAAHQEILGALTLFDTCGPVSDYHLALVHAADCAFESKDVSQAKIHLDYIPQQVDSRVDFPRAYMKAKVSQQTLSLDQFTDINGHWKARYEKYVETMSAQDLGKTRVFWNPKTFSLVTENKHVLGKIKPLSLEGLLIKMLMRGPQSKELLSEALCPEFSSTENIDDRFFRLKNRLQQKLGTMISFDGRNYRLEVEVVFAGSRP